MLFFLKNILLVSALVSFSHCFADQIQITVECEKEKIVIKSETPISISKIIQKLEQAALEQKVSFETKDLKFAAFPVLSMKFHNKAAGENTWLCVGSKFWGDYEIEKESTIRFMKTLNGLVIPEGQNWLFDEEAKEQHPQGDR